MCGSSGSARFPFGRGSVASCFSQCFCPLLYLAACVQSQPTGWADGLSAQVGWVCMAGPSGIAVFVCVCGFVSVAVVVAVCVCGCVCVCVCVRVCACVSCSVCGCVGLWVGLCVRALVCVWSPHTHMKTTHERNETISRMSTPQPPITIWIYLYG